MDLNGYCQATGTGNGDWDWGLGFGTGIWDLDLGLVLGTGIGDWYWGLGNGEWEIGNGKMENTLVPGDDCIISWATTPQLLTMKERPDNKVPFVRMSQDDPLTHPAQT